MRLISFINCVIFTGLMFSCNQTTNKSTEENTNLTEGNHQVESSSVSTDCRNCGMPSSAFPKWQSKLKSDDGELYFCSPRCMLLTVKHAENHPKGIHEIWVKNFYNTKDINAQKAFYVTNSDVLGPMGKDFIPHQDKASAEEFMKDHQGGKMFRFDEITLDVVKEVIKN